MAGKRGRGGQPPKPTALRLADGTHHRYRHGDPTEALAAESLDAPERPHFENAAAADLWDSVVPRLINLGIAKETDAAMLRSMCEMWGLYRAAYAAAEQDATDKDARIAVTAYWAKFETAASRFGLNASDRGRMRVETHKSGGVRRRQA